MKSFLLGLVVSLLVTSVYAQYAPVFDRGDQNVGVVSQSRSEKLVQLILQTLRENNRKSYSEDVLLTDLKDRREISTEILTNLFNKTTAAVAEDACETNFNTELPRQIMNSIQLYGAGSMTSIRDLAVVLNNHVYCNLK